MLYKLVKDQLKNVKSAISDNSILVLNRRSIYYSPINNVNAFLAFFGLSHIGLQTRLFLEGFSPYDYISAGRTQIICVDPEVTLAALYLYIRNADHNVECYFPSGMAKIPEYKGLAAEVSKDFLLACKKNFDVNDTESLKIILCTAKNFEKASYAVSLLAESRNTILGMKDFLLTDYSDLREVFEKYGINPKTTLEGNAYEYRPAAFK